MGTKTKNSSKNTAKDINNKIDTMDKYIRMHFDQINETMLTGFMRFEAMIEVLIENNIVTKEQYGEKLKLIYNEMQSNVDEEVSNAKGASCTIDLTNVEPAFEEEAESEEEVS